MIRILKRYMMAWPLVCLLIFNQLSLADEAPVLSPFSGADPASGIPESWEPLIFPKISTPTEYRPMRSGGRTVIEAHSKGGASGLIHALNADPFQFPWLSWQWQVDHALKGSDVTQKSRDDCAARIYVAFKFEGRTRSWWHRFKYKTKRLFAGRELPGSAIIYVWTDGLKAGSIINSPYTNDIKLIVVQSGDRFKGRWIEERRNIVEDYRTAFGTSAPTMMGIAIMTDTDNTGESVKAYYGDIRLDRKAPGATER